MGDKKRRIEVRRRRLLLRTLLLALGHSKVQATSKRCASLLSPFSLAASFRTSAPGSGKRPVILEPVLGISMGSKGLSPASSISVVRMKVDVTSSNDDRSSGYRGLGITMYGSILPRWICSVATTILLGIS
jgi:hypothetical protein